MRRLALVGLALMLTFGGASAQGSNRTGRSVVAYPAQAELDHYPIIWTTTPNQAEVQRTMAALGLKLDTLKADWTGFNWHRNLGRFVLETIPAGTEVYSDSTGTPRYRADCANRLVKYEDCPNCGVVGGTADTVLGTASSDSAKASAQSKKTADSISALIAAQVAAKNAKKPSALSRFSSWLWHGLGVFFGGLWDLLAFLLPLFFVGLLLVLLAYWLMELWKNRKKDSKRGVRKTQSTTSLRNTASIPVAPATSTPRGDSKGSFMKYSQDDPKGDIKITIKDMSMLRYSNDGDGVKTIQFRER